MPVTKSSCCCCTVITGQPMGWGTPCQPCPPQDSFEFQTLCPHGAGMTFNGDGMSCSSACSLCNCIAILAVGCMDLISRNICSAPLWSTVTHTHTHTHKQGKNLFLVLLCSHTHTHTHTYPHTHIHTHTQTHTHTYIYISLLAKEIYRLIEFNKKLVMPCGLWTSIFQFCYSLHPSTIVSCVSAGHQTPVTYKDKFYWGCTEGTDQGVLFVWC